jgi:prepilin-type N-terminal cleavage/methylation domain-containing protein
VTARSGAVSPHGCRTRQRGVTLTELMIALTVGLLVIGGAAQMFVGSRAAFAEIERIAALHDNLRFVTGFIARDIRSAALAGDGHIEVTLAQDSPSGFPLEIRRPAVRGCDGALPGADGRVTNRYTLGIDALRCNTPGASPQALVDGVRAAHVCVIHAGNDMCGGSGDPVALRITLVLQSRAGGVSYDHELTFTTAMRNAVLARYNAW